MAKGPQRSFSTHIRVTIDKHKLANGKIGYYLRWTDPHTGKRPTVACGTDIVQAKHARSRKEQELNEYLLENNEFPYSLDSLRQDFIEMEAPRLRRATVRAYLNAFKTFRTYIGGHTLLHQIGVLNVKKYIFHRQQARTRKGQRLTIVSLNSEIRRLRAIFGYAVDNELIKRNPFSKIRKFKEPPREIRVISPHQESLILEAIDNMYLGKQYLKLREKLKCLLEVAIQSGFRVAELAAIRWKDIDESNRAIRLTCYEKPDDEEDYITKSNQNRVAFVKKATMDRLSMLRTLSGGEADNLVFGYKCSTSITHIFGRISKYVGFKFTPQDLRHTCATRLAMVATPQVSNRYMGHKEVSTTLKYYINIPDPVLKDAMEAANPDVKKAKKVASPFADALG